MMTLSRWKIFAVVASAIFGLLFTLPNFVPANVLATMPSWLPHQKLNLGLDLQGGSYLLLEVDTAALRVERLNNLAEEVGTTLRNGNIAITDPSQAGGIVRVRVTDPTKVDAAATLLRKSVGSPLAGVAGGTDVVVSVRPDQHIEVAFAAQAQSADAAKAVEQSIEIIPGL